MRHLFRAAGAALLLLSAACRPDQIEHLKESQRIGIEAENWQVKRIMPEDLLRATRWSGDSLTRHADRELLRVLTEKLAQGGIAAALPYCRPETFPAVDSVAKTLQASVRRVSSKPRNSAHLAELTTADLQPDTARQIARPNTETFFYQRPITINDALCLRCHGEVGQDIRNADYALIQKQYPQDQATGYALGQSMGAWRLTLKRPGVAEFWTMKTRKLPRHRTTR
ncbi:c-type heme family protein [Hymenobacter sediminicola]|uniref:DUF3365 domain-containing protein n=1 Tax=Hymenobacter sediminicola TaxID=2761579 RepID=A0A7G7W7N9_9BACT|nr:DUF3365 domain-containing protein [Hymenobacter sediminicola]QNH62382.1 DUF3365 domain-containing protein [Hymenobacter sediminicola]